MPKQNPLSRALKSQSTPAEPSIEPIASVDVSPPAKRAPSRVGRVLIGGHFVPDVQIELKVIAAQERTSVQALLAEGINAVFARRHKPQIATLSTKDA